MLAARLALTCALLNFLISTLVFAQMAWQNRNLDVGRVGLRIACKCGCPDTVATCNMLACGFSKPAKEKISAMQQAGASDQTIIDSFTKEYGPDIFRSEPNSLGWIIPYSVLALGVMVIVWFVRRYRRPQPLTEAGTLPDSAILGRYQEQIEKDLARLD